MRKLDLTVPGETAAGLAATSSRLDDMPLGFDADTITVDSIEEVRRLSYGSAAELERLRAWVDTPSAAGLRRGMGLWLLGRHAEACSILEPESATHPALVVCLAHAAAAAGDFDAALALLGPMDQHPEYCRARMAVADARVDPDGLDRMLERHTTDLPPADRAYYTGRLREMRRDPEGAIALYEEALELDDRHGPALFRLALNLDLRGCDEEARVLYERALLCPPVNSACVVNLGILYEDLGNYRRAMQCYDLVVQADPGNERARLYRRDAAASLTMYLHEEELPESKLSRTLRTPIGDFELSARSSTCLMKMNVRTLGDLVAKSATQLLRQHGFGETSLAEINEVLHQKGLSLGMDIHGRGAHEPPDSQPPAAQPEPDSPDVTRRPISQLDLSVRSRRVVSLLHLATIGDLADTTEAELLGCPNFGQSSLNEVRRKLDELGLALRT